MHAKFENFLQVLNPKVNLIFSDDGNFVLYDVNNRALWATGTNRNGGHFAYLQDDAQLTIRGSNSESVWVSGALMQC